MMERGKRVQVVIPVFNEAETLPVLFERLEAVFAAERDYAWSVIMVDDGSSDDSGRILRAKEAEDGRYRVVALSRNFGHQPAVSAGLSVADGDAVILMDGDLQDPPEVIPELVAAWKKGAEVVRAERRSRQERGLRRLGMDLFHRFFNLFSDYPIPANSGLFSLLSRQAVMAYNQLPERHRFYPGLSAWIGFRQETVCYDRAAREHGEPKQSLRRLVRYAMDALFSFSYVPLRFMSYAGLLISLLGFALGGYFALKRLLGLEVAFTGFTTLVILVLTLGGLQLIALGILGEYLARTYDEVKKRPYFIVRGAPESSFPAVRSAMPALPRDKSRDSES